MELGERKKKILNAIVETYIATGEPVGSKVIAQITDMGLSSATIRNEMSELAEMGFIVQPYTSAGRIPTQKGYRMYVDRLMDKYQLNFDEKREIDNLLKINGGDIESTLSKAGELLAQITGFASLSTSCQDRRNRVRRIQVVPAGRRSLLLVILATSGVIKTRLCRIDEDLTEDMLQFFSRLVNDKVSGKTFEEVTPGLMDAVSGELFEYTYALRPVLGIILEEIRDIMDAEVFLGGEANLLAHREFDGTKVAEIIRYLEKRDEILRLIEDIGGGISVRIGTENGISPMEDSTLIAAPYDFQGRTAGTIGIIGPTRLDYARLMSNIEYFSTVLSRLINEAFGDV
ncbi:MAG TPA: heat-inducible transcriptional repressor HrcA [Clostridia bacterium]|nr:heat-inducible transcriptional repressor HrcA [Clostridia bacterium]